MIDACRVPGLVSPHQPPKARRGLLTLHLGPVGFCGKRPASVAEVKAEGRRLLGGLRWLHDNGWVHRDIRPPNILFAEGEWYLNDLEWTNRRDSDMGDYNPNPQYLPPKHAGVEGVPWTVACDMWQLGKLLEYWDQLDSDGRSYVSTQTQDNGPTSNRRRFSGSSTDV